MSAAARGGTPNRRIASIVLLVLVIAMAIGLYACKQQPGTGSGATPVAGATKTGTAQPAKSSGAKATGTKTGGAKTTAARGGGATDPASGLRWIDAAELPAEARTTLQLIDRGGPYPYDKDGATFGNFEGILPQQPRGYYKEYTVKTPGEGDRGARRIVTGNNDKEFFWTPDHYASFARIRR
ncbi:guanyl-specific ribonuclease [Enemella evansiae]|nr:ribonuclease domain-containing protein [Enemella evansiae]